jgi:hypothetical protein
MKKTSCIALADGDRINLIIMKGEKGYSAFAKVLKTIDKKGFMSWYGDVTTADGKEQSGLIITCKP